MDSQDLVVDYGSRQAGEKDYVLRERGKFGSNLFHSNSKSEVIAEAQRRKGWEPVDGSEQTYGRQIEEHSEQRERWMREQGLVNIVSKVHLKRKVEDRRCVYVTEEPDEISLRRNEALTENRLVELTAVRGMKPSPLFIDPTNIDLVEKA